MAVSSVWQPKIILEGINRGAQDIRLYMADPKVFSSFGTQLNLWRDSISIWKESPILGTGIGDFNDDVEKMIAEGGAYATSPMGHAHSIYFDALATTGTLGLAGMLFFMFWQPFRFYAGKWNEATNPWQKFYLSGGMLAIYWVRCFWV